MARRRDVLEPKRRKLDGDTGNYQIQFLQIPLTRVKIEVADNAGELNFRLGQVSRGPARFERTQRGKVTVKTFPAARVMKIKVYAVLVALTRPRWFTSCLTTARRRVLYNEPETRKSEGP
jgi:hypothetical protein